MSYPRDHEMPRPSLLCTGAKDGKHSMASTYDRPWWNWFRKRYVWVCINDECNEIRRSLRSR